MKIVVVVGSGSGCGKTTVACRILRGIPGLGAVKLSPREGECGIDRGPGAPGKDTYLFADSGAVRVARIVGPREAAPVAWERLKGEFGECRGVVIEGTRAIDFPEEKYVLFVAGRKWLDDREKHNRSLIERSDIIVEMPSLDNEKNPGEMPFSSHLIVKSSGGRDQGSHDPSPPRIDLVDFVRGFLALPENG